MRILLNMLTIGMSLTISAMAYAMPDSFADLAEQQRESVVNISTTKIIQAQMPNIPQQMPFGHGSPFEDFFKDFFDQMPKKESHALGTGFILSREGFVITNNHVVDGADKIIVKNSDGQEFEAELVGTDAKLDIAVLKIDAKNLNPVKLGDSSKLRVGDWVVAIGNPFGLEQTVTAGIVSALGRVIGSGPYDDFIQTDAAINPGNSGGPLFNVKGELIGINTAIYTRSGGNNGIGFAIPINLARPIIDELRKNGFVERAMLGVQIRDVDEETRKALNLKDKRGALVAQVSSGSAAEKAGIEAGDVIVEIDGEAIKSSHDLPIRVARHHPGDRVKVVVMRNGERKIIPVVVDAMEEASARGKQGKQQSKMQFGLALRPLEASDRQQLDVRVDYGLVVERVMRGSPAALADIQPGDVIYKANNVPIKSLNDLRKVVSQLDDDEALRVLMDRHGNKTFRIIRRMKDRD